MMVTVSDRLGMSECCRYEESDMLLSSKDSSGIFFALFGSYRGIADCHDATLLNWTEIYMHVRPNTTAEP